MPILYWHNYILNIINKSYKYQHKGKGAEGGWNVQTGGERLTSTISAGLFGSLMSLSLPMPTVLKHYAEMVRISSVTSINSTISSLCYNRQEVLPSAQGCPSESYANPFRNAWRVIFIVKRASFNWAVNSRRRHCLNIDKLRELITFLCSPLHFSKIILNIYCLNSNTFIQLK